MRCCRYAVHSTSSPGAPQVTTTIMQAVHLIVHITRDQDSRRVQAIDELRRHGSAGIALTSLWSREAGGLRFQGSPTAHGDLIMNGGWSHGARPWLAVGTSNGQRSG